MGAECIRPPCRVKPENSWIKLLFNRSSHECGRNRGAGQEGHDVEMRDREMRDQE